MLAEIILALVSFEHELADEHQQKRSAKVANSLYVATCRVAHGPREQQPRHHALHLIRLEDSDLWLSPKHVDLDLLQVSLLEV